jgi:exopolysaccharide production protein ExoQ
MGRDMTLTGRTEIWHDIFVVASQHPLLGVGYGAFWIGEMANIPWSHNMTWTLGQAHNGYIDIYLQLGWMGILLLIAIIVVSIPKLLRTFTIDFEYGKICSTLFLLILFVNITESTFLRGEHALWFLFLLVVLNVPLKKKNHDFKVTVQ